eukprot:5448634-Pyramimonas_sp.AAC.1
MQSCWRSFCFAIPPSGRLGRASLTHAPLAQQVPPQLGACASTDWLECARRWCPPVSMNRSANDSNDRTSNQSDSNAFA